MNSKVEKNSTATRNGQAPIKNMTPYERLKTVPPTGPRGEALDAAYFYAAFNEFAQNVEYGSETEFKAATRLLHYIEADAVQVAVKSLLLSPLPTHQDDSRSLSKMRRFVESSDAAGLLQAALETSPALVQFTLLQLVRARQTQTLADWGDWSWAASGDERALDWSDEATASTLRQRFATFLQAEEWRRKEWEVSGLEFDRDLLEFKEVEAEDEQANEVEAAHSRT